MNANYFIALAGASAALTGLIFVSLSINLHRILSVEHLPGRALVALMLLVNIPLVASFCLINQQSASLLGLEILICGLTVWTFIIRNDFRVYKERMASPYRRYYIFNVIFSQLASLPYLIAAFTLILGFRGGLFWLVPAFSLSIVKSLMDSWVLLVEINR